MFVYVHEPGRAEEDLECCTQNSRDLPVSLLPHCWDYKKWTTTSRFLCVFQALNSGPHSCKSNTLWTELSLHPNFYLLIKIILFTLSKINSSLKNIFGYLLIFLFLYPNQHFPSFFFSSQALPFPLPPSTLPHVSLQKGWASRGYQSAMFYQVAARLSTSFPIKVLKNIFWGSLMGQLSLQEDGGLGRLANPWCLWSKLNHLLGQKTSGFSLKSQCITLAHCHTQAVPGVNSNHLTLSHQLPSLFYFSLKLLTLWRQVHSIYAGVLERLCFLS